MLRTTKARLAASRRQRHENNEGGFTLIELMVVVLIIAILLAIAVPTFLGAQNKAKDRSAQSSLRNGMTAAKTIYADKQSYTDATEAALDTIEPSLEFEVAATDSTGPKSVSVSTNVAGDTWYGAAKSATGTCFFIKDMVTATRGGTEYGTGAVACDGAAALAGTGITWDPDGW